MKVGDYVTWESHSRSKVQRKTGVIVAIVPPKTDVRNLIDRSIYLPRFAVLDYPQRRYQESYLVSVEDEQAIRQRKPLLYWPNVSALELVPKHAAAGKR